jgi:hypothetical protein
MSLYIPYKVNLRDSQKQDLAKAVKTKAAIKLRLYFSQLQNGTDTLGLTKTQIEKIEKRREEKRGADITLSASQIAKQGGFLGTLLFNAAKTILPTVGISALEGLTSGLVNKIISGKGCDYNEFALQVLPHLLKNFSNEDRKAIKEGGFVFPLIATLAATLLPTLISQISGKGYQVRPPAGRGYQVRPPAGRGYQVRPPKNYLITP